MNEYDPEWMQKLKTTDPLRAKTFTSEKMSVIEMAVENMNERSRGRKRKVWIPGFAAVVAAVVLVKRHPAKRPLYGMALGSIRE